MGKRGRSGSGRGIERGGDARNELKHLLLRGGISISLKREENFLRIGMPCRKREDVRGERRKHREKKRLFISPPPENIPRSTPGKREGVLPLT